MTIDYAPPVIPSKVTPMHQVDARQPLKPTPRPAMNPNIVRSVSFMADYAGCGHYRIMWPDWLLNNTYTLPKNGKPQISIIDSNVMIFDHQTFYNDMRIIRVQRQATQQQLEFMKHFLFKIAKTKGISIVYDADDWFFEIPTFNHAYKAYTPEILKNISEIVYNMDYLTVTSMYLRKMFHEKVHIPLDKILVVPNMLPKFLFDGFYDKDKIQEKIEQREHRKPRILWTGSSTHFNLDKTGNTDDVAILRQYVHKTYKQFQWVFMGVPPDALKHIGMPDNIECHSWCDILNYPRRMLALDCDVAVIGLHDCNFNRGKCVAGNTKIQIKGRGLVPIAKICGEKSGMNAMEQDMECLSSDGTFKKITHYYKSENEENVKRLVTRNGFVIQGTPYHKVMTADGWKELKDIHQGNLIQLCPPILEENKELFEFKIPCLWTKKLYVDKFKEAQNWENCPVLRVTETFAKLFGYILGDGYFSGNSSIGITCCTRDQEVIEEVCTLISSFGIDAKVKKYKDHKAVMIKANSKSFRFLFEYLGFVGSLGRGKGKCKNLFVPYFIWRSKKSIIKQFILGLFESDATVGECGITFSTKSEIFAREIQLLLLALGIKSRICSKDSYIGEKSHGQQFYITISRQWTEKYYEVFGEKCFTSTFKLDRIKKIIGKDHSNAYKEQELLWDEVVYNRVTGTQYVYDITVEDKHCYMANGILSHNSNIKLLEFGALGIPAVLQKIEPYKFAPLQWTTMSELETHVNRLLTDKKFYMQTAGAQRGIVDKNFWLEDNLDIWAQLYMGNFEHMKRLTAEKMPEIV